MIDKPEKTRYRDEDDLADEFCLRVGCSECHGELPESYEPTGYGCDAMERFVEENSHLITVEDEGNG